MDREGPQIAIESLLYRGVVSLTTDDPSLILEAIVQGLEVFSNEPLDGSGAGWGPGRGWENSLEGNGGGRGYGSGSGIFGDGFGSADEHSPMGNGYGSLDGRDQALGLYYLGGGWGNGNGRCGKDR